MKPTEQQKQWLQDYLDKVMEYRETYEEVYDHILLALEDKPEMEFFESNVSNIIEEDFGSNNGLLELENNCRHETETTAEAKYRDTFKRWFTSPQIIIVAALFMVLFYLQLPVVKTHGALLFLFVFLLVLPTIILSIRGFRLGLNYGNTKTSIKDEIFRKITFKSNLMLWNISILLKVSDLIARYVFNIKLPLSSEQSDSINILYGMVTIILVLMIVHILSVIKLYRGEFKTGIIAN